MTADFHDTMGQAFANLKRYEACPQHQWARPRERRWKEYGRERTAWETRCRLCGLRASRPTPERLRQEVLEAPRSS